MTGPAAPLWPAAPADVSRETLDRLRIYQQLLLRWNRTHNLVSRGDPADVWHRHFTDSLQLVGLAPEATRWLDLGSGAGFPGLVVAIAASERQPGTVVDLIESSHRKCAFLRAVVAATAAVARVHAARVEQILPAWVAPVDVVSSRALASLDQLLAWSGHLVRGDTRALFHKGVTCREELAIARESWDFEVLEHVSDTSPTARILEIRNVSPKRKTGQ